MIYHHICLSGKRPCHPIYMYNIPIYQNKPSMKAIVFFLNAFIPSYNKPTYQYNNTTIPQY